MTKDIIKVILLLAGLVASCAGRDHFRDLLERARTDQFSEKYREFDTAITGILESRKVSSVGKKTTFESASTSLSLFTNTKGRIDTREITYTKITIAPSDGGNGRAECNMLHTETTKVTKLKKGATITVEGRLTQWSPEEPRLTLHACRLK